MDIELELNGLNCTNCAQKIEEMSGQLLGVNNSDLNFVTKKLRIDIEEARDYSRIKDQVTELINELEPGLDIVEISSNKREIELELNGLNCTDCAGKIEDMSRKLEGVDQVDFNFVSKKLRVGLLDPSYGPGLAREITDLVNRLEPDVEVIDLSKKASQKSLKIRIGGQPSQDLREKILMFSQSLKGVEAASIDSKNILELTYRSDIDAIGLREEAREIINTLDDSLEVEDLASQPALKKGWFEKIDRGQAGSILGAALLGLMPRALGLTGQPRFLVFLLAYLIVGHKIIRQALVNIRAGRAFDENFLMTLATLAAFAIGEYPEALMVMLLYQLGEILQDLAVNHSRDSISSLMNIRPDSARLERDGRELIVDPGEVRQGDIIVVRPGEKVALDGRVLSGQSSLDTSNITGESLPRAIGPGDEIVSGVVNLDGLLRIEVAKEFSESTVSKILDLVENASSKKAETENFITRFSKFYTPFVVVVAIGLATLPALLGRGDFSDWLYRAAVFLVISCPCALVISVPLGFFGGLGGASKEGILIKGGNYLEALADIETVVFDKTGTITEGSFTVSRLESYGELDQDEILEIAAHAESYSNHPIARSIVASYPGRIDESRIDGYREIAGRGLAVEIDGIEYFLGNKSLMEDENIELRELDSIGSLVYVARGQEHLGSIVVSDRPKENVGRDLELLKEAGVKNTVILSGDNEATVARVAESLGIDSFYGDLLPQEKLEIFEGILAKKTRGRKVAFVGDGVNDAPVLARADIGIAMGGLGSDAAIEASDLVIMTDDLGKISKGIRIGRHTRRLVIENILLALLVKAGVLLLGALGRATMWQAVFADVGVSILAIMNSIRALNTKGL